MAIKCIIVDDEPLAIEIVESYVSRIDQLQLQGSFRNAVQAFAYLQEHTVDLIFLDIQMPKLSGIEFLKTLKNPPKGDLHDGVSRLRHRRLRPGSD
jgi:two-component SAPR family response regulator